MRKLSTDGGCKGKRKEIRFDDPDGGEECRTIRREEGEMEVCAGAWTRMERKNRFQGPIASHRNLSRLVKRKGLKENIKGRDHNQTVRRLRTEIKLCNIRKHE
jgi:hypothetical protein